MAELAKLLGFMSAWDRRDTLAKYEALFDEAADEAEFIASLGSPTKLAIGLALNYVPSPAPAAVAEQPAEAESEPVQSDADVQEAESADAPLAEAVEAPAAPPVEEAPPSVVEFYAEPVRPKRKVRAFGLIVAILFGLVIGLPIAVVLICIGIPFILLGVSVVALAVWAVLTVVGMLTMISDILIVVGAALVLCGLGLLLAWFGLWLSFELGYLWISGVVLRLGRVLTYKKEVAAE